MRLILLCFVWWWSVAVGADEWGDMRLVQASADLPVIDVWLDLPAGTLPKPEQFSASVGAQTAKVMSLDAFAQTGEGVAYVFLVDISRSLNPQQFAQIKQALRQWLAGLGEQDRAAIISFGRDVKQLVAFTNDQEKLRQAVDTLATSDMETSFYRSLLEAIRFGRQEGNLPKRRAVVVLSDGIDDTLSGVTLDEVFKQSQEYRVPIYSIGFAAGPMNDDKRNGLKIMGMLARQSGGQFVQAEAGRLDDAYAQQHQRIVQAYRLRLACPGCVADGQTYRLNLAWQDGQRSVRDGMDLRLLPKANASPSDASTLWESANQAPLYVYALGLLVFFILLLWLYRQRLRQNETDDLLGTMVVQSLEPKLIANGLPLRLTVVAGVQKGLVHELLLTDSAMIGRAAACDLSIADDVEVSAQHALLKFSHGRLLVRDLNSTNGTLVNGVPVHNEYPLQNGDLLLLGRTELRVGFAGKGA